MALVHDERVCAVVAAGDQRASRDIYGQSKVYLEVAGRPLVTHVVATLQKVPEVSSVWVVGDAERLEAVFADREIRSQLTKPLYIVPQFRSLYENAWETFRRTLTGNPQEGRDPTEDELDREILFLSSDLPFATSRELSNFIHVSRKQECDYALGLVSEAALIPFRPSEGKPGIEVACFNTRDGRLRQNNLHFVKPARLGNRHLVEQVYEHRHQREWRDMLGLSWRLLRSERGGLSVVAAYLMLHVAGLADRWHLRRLADALRQRVTVERVESGIGRLLDARFRLVIIEDGGAAIDIDTEEEYDAVQQRFQDWREMQEALADKLYGPLPLGAGEEEGPS